MLTLAALILYLALYVADNDLMKARIFGLVKPALYKKILDLLNNEHLRVEISNNAKKHIIDNFTLERSTIQYIELYKSVLGIA